MTTHPRVLVARVIGAGMFLAPIVFADVPDTNWLMDVGLLGIGVFFFAPFLGPTPGSTGSPQQEQEAEKPSRRP